MQNQPTWSIFQVVAESFEESLPEQQGLYIDIILESRLKHLSLYIINRNCWSTNSTAWIRNWVRNSPPNVQSSKLTSKLDAHSFGTCTCSRTSGSKFTEVMPFQALQYLVLLMKSKWKKYCGLRAPGSAKTSQSPSANLSLKFCPSHRTLHWRQKVDSIKFLPSSSILQAPDILVHADILFQGSSGAIPHPWWQCTWTPQLTWPNTWNPN